MKLLKYFAGSLIISFGILMVLAIFIRAVQLELPIEHASYIPIAWIGLALCIMPFAKKIIRIE